MLITRLRNKELMTVLQATKVQKDEASFIAKNDGIHYRTMDHSHISLLDIALPKEAFQYYNDHEGEPDNIAFTVKPDELLKVLKRIDKDEIVEITVDGEDITIRSISVRKPLTYKTKSLSNEYEETKLPNVTYAVKVNIQHNALKEALEDLSLLTNVVRIITNKEKVKLVAVNDRDAMAIEYEHNRQAVMIYMLDSKAECRSVYKIQELLNMLKAVETKYVVLQYNDKTALRLQFLLPFKCEMHYYLAPKVED
jgi:DNA polymerase III sliding clamp (beta) subunit (PCNA family)